MRLIPTLLVGLSCSCMHVCMAVSMLSVVSPALFIADWLVGSSCSVALCVLSVVSLALFIADWLVGISHSVALCMLSVVSSALAIVLLLCDVCDGRLISLSEPLSLCSPTVSTLRTAWSHLQYSLSACAEPPFLKCRQWAWILCPHFCDGSQ